MEKYSLLKKTNYRTINLSILDFKYEFQARSEKRNSPINLSILDFKFFWYLW